jgi:hypothetical protein
MSNNLCRTQLGQIAIIAAALNYQLTWLDHDHFYLTLPDGDFAAPLHLHVDPRPSLETGLADGTSLIVKIYENQLPGYRPGELITLERMIALNKLLEPKARGPKVMPRTSFISTPAGISCVGVLNLGTGPNESKIKDFLAELLDALTRWLLFRRLA